MTLLSWLLHGERATEAESTQRISSTVERVMAMNPHLRLARHYQARMASAVAVSLKYVGDLAEALPAPREASAAAWATDPFIHAFFAAPDDVAQAFSRSADLRAHFERNPELQEAYAVLGMAMLERHILGVGLEGETLRRDVPQTTVNFSDHQVRICGRSDADLRHEIVRRMIDQLALAGLAGIAADKSRRDRLNQERALLKTRLQLLERQGAGMGAMIGGEAEAGSAELAQLHEQIEDNERALSELGVSTEALERDLDRVCEVFAEPGAHLTVSIKRLRLDRMNVVLTENSPQEGATIEFRIARIPGDPPRTRAFALVRFARADLLPAKSMLDEAARLLARGV